MSNTITDKKIEEPEHHYRGYKIIKGQWYMDGEPCFDRANLVTIDKKEAIEGIIFNNRRHSCDIVLKVAGDIPKDRPTDNSIILEVYNSFKDSKNGIWFYELGEIDLALDLSLGYVIYPPSWAKIGLKAPY